MITIVLTNKRGAKDDTVRFGQVSERFSDLPTIELSGRREILVESTGHDRFARIGAVEQGHIESRAIAAIA